MKALVVFLNIIVCLSFFVVDRSYAADVHIEENGPEEYFLAIAFANGIEVPRNKKLAAHYFEKAALIGHGPSQRNLGIMNCLGDGIEKNSILGYAWLLIATTNKDEVAPRIVAELNEILTSIQINGAKEKATKILDSIVKNRE